MVVPFRAAREVSPLWVMSRHRATSASCPLFPSKRTSTSAVYTSALCQEETSESHQFVPKISPQPSRTRNVNGTCVLQGLYSDRVISISILYIHSRRRVGANRLGTAPAPLPE